MIHCFVIFQFLYSGQAASIISEHDPDDSRLFLYVALQNIHGPQEAPDARTKKNTKLWLIDT